MGSCVAAHAQVSCLEYPELMYPWKLLECPASAASTARFHDHLTFLFAAVQTLFYQVYLNLTVVTLVRVRSSVV
jgi:hypothetical protein